MPSPPRRGLSVVFASSVALAFLTGMALRLYGLADQVLVDDEWHALHRVLRAPFVFPLLDDGWSDDAIHYSAFQVLYDRVLLRTVGLSELSMRMASLVAGIATVVVFPLLLRRQLSGGSCAMLAWLLAVSPLLVFYSRYARPYAPALLFGLLALVAFFRWWTGALSGSRASPYVIATLATAYLHPSALPAVLAPFAVAAATLVARRGRGDRGWRHLTALAAATAAGLLVILGTPLLWSGRLSSPLLHRPATLETFVGAAELWFGLARSELLLLAMLGMTLFGALRLLRDRPALGVYLCACTAAQLSAILILRPHGVRFPIVFSRYDLLLLPILLVFAAVGSSSLSRALGRLRHLVPPAVALALFLAGPLPRIYSWPNSFTNHASWQFDYDPSRYFPKFAPRVLSPIYDDLATLPPGTLTIAEGPWTYFWHSYAYTQRRHGQRTVVGFVSAPDGPVRDGEVAAGRTDVRLRNAVSLYDPAAIAARGVDLVLLHKELDAELEVPFPVDPFDVSEVEAHLRRTYGTPVAEDRFIAVFATNPSVTILPEGWRRAGPATPPAASQPRPPRSPGNAPGDRLP